MSQEFEEAGRRPENQSGEMAFTTGDLADLRAQLQSDRLTIPDRTQIDGGEIVRFTPEFVRKDEATGEDAQYRFYLCAVWGPQKRMSGI